MADNLDVTPGSGKTVAADDVGGALHQRVKPTFGGDGVGQDVTNSNPLPTGHPKNLTAITASITASGNTTIHTPTTDMAIRVHWVYAVNDPSESSSPLIKIGFSDAGGASITDEKYRVWGTQKERIFEGAVNEKLIVNLSTAGVVAFTAHIEEFTP